MLISDIRLLPGSEHCELRAAVKFETHWVWGDEPFLLWYRFPADLQEWLDPDDGDPFLAAFLAPAMVLGEPLEIQAAISQKLYRAVPEIQSIYCCWNRKLKKIEVRAPLLGPRTREVDKPSHRGLFFSLGMDSTYSLLKNVENHPDDEDTITHLINVLGFDMYLWEGEGHPLVLSNIWQVANSLGKQVLPVTTNLRDLTDRIVDWPLLHHGAALASVGLALGGMFQRIHIAATHTYADLFPLGSHPILDPLWSTEELTFVHDGCEASRLDKARVIARFPVALQRLHVCTAISAGYSCGWCPKCIISAIELHAVGALSGCGTLPERIDLQQLHSIQVSNETRRVYLEELLPALGSSEVDSAIRSAVERCLASRRE